MKRLLAGPRAVEAALRGRDAEAVAIVYVERGRGRELGALLERAKARGVAVEERGRADLDALARGLKHQGALAVGGDYPYRSLEQVLAEAGRPALLLALDEITDPHNLGAIVRSAVAFGADGLVLPKRRSAGVTPTVVRVSTGATEHARIARVTNLARSLRELREQGLQIVGLAGEPEATSLRALPEAPPAGRVLVVGSEGRGMRRLVRVSCDVLARIELPGPVEALNASVAAGIALYALAGGG